MLKLPYSIAISLIALGTTIQSEEPCDTLQTMGYVFDSKEGPIEHIKLFGMAQYQIGHVDGTDSAGYSFSD